MSTNWRVTLFGIVSGLGWSLIVFRDDGLISLKNGETYLLLTAGVAAALTLCFALKFPLARYGVFWATALGLLTFPVGAFLFGFIFALAAMIRTQFTVGGEFVIMTPFAFGSMAVLLSIKGRYYLIPGAFLTTWLLRVVIRLGKKTKHAA